MGGSRGLWATRSFILVALVVVLLPLVNGKGSSGSSGGRSGKSAPSPRSPSPPSSRYSPSTSRNSPSASGRSWSLSRSSGGKKAVSSSSYKSKNMGYSSSSRSTGYRAYHRGWSGSTYRYHGGYYSHRYYFWGPPYGYYYWGHPYGYHHHRYHYHNARYRNRRCNRCECFGEAVSDWFRGDCPEILKRPGGLKEFCTSDCRSKLAERVRGLFEKCDDIEEDEAQLLRRFTMQLGMMCYKASGDYCMQGVQALAATPLRLSEIDWRNSSFLEDLELTYCHPCVEDLSRVLSILRGIGITTQDDLDNLDRLVKTHNMLCMPGCPTGEVFASLSLPPVKQVSVPKLVCTSSSCTKERLDIANSRLKQNNAGDATSIAVITQDVQVNDVPNTQKLTIEVNCWKLDEAEAAECFGDTTVEVEANFTDTTVGWAKGVVSKVNGGEAEGVKIVVTVQLNGRQPVGYIVRGKATTMLAGWTATITAGSRTVDLHEAPFADLSTTSGTYYPLDFVVLLGDDLMTGGELLRTEVVKKRTAASDNTFYREVLHNIPLLQRVGCPPSKNPRCVHRTLKRLATLSMDSVLEEDTRMRLGYLGVVACALPPSGASSAKEEPQQIRHCAGLREQLSPGCCEFARVSLEPQNTAPMQNSLQQCLTANSHMFQLTLSDVDYDWFVQQDAATVDAAVISDMEYLLAPNPITVSTLGSNEGGFVELGLGAVDAGLGSEAFSDTKAEADAMKTYTPSLQNLRAIQIEEEPDKYMTAEELRAVPPLPNHGSDSGMIAGIIVGNLVGLYCCMGIGYWCYRKRKRESRERFVKDEVDDVGTPRSSVLEAEPLKVEEAPKNPYQMPTTGVVADGAPVPPYGDAVAQPVVAPYGGVVAPYGGAVVMPPPGSDQVGAGTCSAAPYPPDPFAGGPPPPLGVESTPTKTV